uniref:G protein-coupled receptor n=2 Tax=Caenorhabditis tropicalis TaxID=1561998 RepID=A0A1I7UK88_9PELO
MYIPIAFLFSSPMFGIGFGVYGNFTMAFLAIYPPLDQLCTMYIIRDFRDAIRNALTVRKLDRVTTTSQSGVQSRNFMIYQINH